MIINDFSLDRTFFPDTSEIYIVGGSLRDYFLNRSFSDYDIAVSGNVQGYAEKLATKLQGHMVQIGKPDKSLLRVISRKGVFDISPINGQSVEEDLGKRDLTINAMAYHPFSGKIIDPFGGIRDLKDKKIRMISKETFRSDPIRLLRTYRMAALLGFDITSETESMVEKEAGQIRRSAGERIREELLKIMHTEKSHPHICQMVKNGLLLFIVPELKALKGSIQNKYHSHDVFGHTMKSYGYLEESLNTFHREFPELSNDITRTVYGKSAALLKWSMLLHDIGKPAARTEDRKGNVHFYGHSRKGAEIAMQISDRIKLSKKERRFIDTIIRYHTLPLHLYLSKENQGLTQKGLTRFFIKCGCETPDLLLHSLADMKGKGRDKRSQSFIQFARNTLSVYYTDYIPRTLTPPLLTGHDIINTFGISPSPLFHIILKQVEEARLSGNIKSKNEAIRHAKSIINNKIDHTTS